MDPQPLLLMTPGPTRVPERVLRAGARPMLHHRSREFSRELATVVELLGPIFGTRAPVLPIHTTGRGALEATICNVCSVGDEIAVCCNGKFGEMWAAFAESYGVRVHRIETDWDRNVDPAAVDVFLAVHPNVRAVAMTYTDSSTGGANDVAAVARVAAARGVLTLVDGVSSIGGMPFEFDEWGVDVAVTASQKCLMSSTGLAFVAVSDRAWAAAERARLPRNYWDFAAVQRAVTAAKPETPGSTPVHLMLQVAEAVRMIHEEGLDRVLARHAMLADRVRRGVRELGLEMQCQNLARVSSTMTAISLTAPLTPAAVRAGLEARGILTAAALGPYASAFRIGHMGDIRLDDVTVTLDALRDVVSAQRSGAAHPVAT